VSPFHLASITSHDRTTEVNKCRRTTYITSPFHKGSVFLHEHGIFFIEKMNMGIHHVTIDRVYEKCYGAYLRRCFVLVTAWLVGTTKWTMSVLNTTSTPINKEPTIFNIDIWLRNIYIINYYHQSAFFNVI
jgi:hypothetical protein